LPDIDITLAFLVATLFVVDVFAQLFAQLFALYHKTNTEAVTSQELDWYKHSTESFGVSAIHDHIVRWLILSIFYVSAIVFTSGILIVSIHKETEVINFLMPFINFIVKFIRDNRV
jgi:hypothetical protein